MRSNTSKGTTKNTRASYPIVSLPPDKKTGPKRTLAELRRYWKSIGAVPVSPEMKRRLIAAGAWGMPDE